MSIDADVLLTAATNALAAVIAEVRQSAPEDPGLLHRIGQLDTALASAKAASAQGQGEAAALLASSLLRDIARDFPAQARQPADLLAEDRLRRSLARRLLEAA